MGAFFGLSNFGRIVSKSALLQRTQHSSSSGGTGRTLPADRSFMGALENQYFAYALFVHSFSEPVCMCVTVFFFFPFSVLLVPVSPAAYTSGGQSLIGGTKFKLISPHRTPEDRQKYRDLFSGLFFSLSLSRRTVSGHGFCVLYGVKNLNFSTNCCPSFVAHSGTFPRHKQ